MKLSVIDLKGASQGEIEVSFPLVEADKGQQAVHDTVVAHMAARRSGTACTKNVGDVNGSNKKPWRQKGTGRARAGSFASPLWRGGGVVFGPKPRDFTKKISKSTRALALRKALTERMKAGDVLVVDDLKLSTPKTKAFSDVLSDLNLHSTTLVVAEGNDKNLALASRNLPLVGVANGAELHTYQVLRYDKIVFTKGAFAVLQKRLGTD